MSVEWSSIDVCALQAHRLDCAGNILTGPTDVVVSCSITDITAEPIAGEGTENRDPNGQGGYCAERTVTNEPIAMSVEATLCSRTDAELMELFGLYRLAYAADGTTPIGIKARCCGETSCRCDPGPAGCTNPGIALMLWHTAWLGKDRHPDFSHAVQIFPKLVFDPTTISVTRNGEFNVYTVTGRGDCNTLFGNGPGDIYPDPAGMDTCWTEILTNQHPDGICGCNVCGYTVAGFVGAP